MSDKVIKYVAPVHVFVHQTPNNQFPWEAIVSGHGETKYLYSDVSRSHLMLKVCAELEKKP